MLYLRNDRIYMYTVKNVAGNVIESLLLKKKMTTEKKNDISFLFCDDDLLYMLLEGEDICYQRPSLAGPRIRLASWMSRCVRVTRLA